MKTIIILTIPVFLSRVFFNPRKPEQESSFDIFICYTADYFKGFTADFDGTSVSLNTDFKRLINNINELQRIGYPGCGSRALEVDPGGPNITPEVK